MGFRKQVGVFQGLGEKEKGQVILSCAWVSFWGDKDIFEVDIGGV